MPYSKIPTVLNMRDYSLGYALLILYEITSANQVRMTRFNYGLVCRGHMAFTWIEQLPLL